MSDNCRCTPAADYFAKLDGDNKNKLLPKALVRTAVVVIAGVLSVVLGFSSWALYQGDQRLECMKARPAKDCSGPSPLERTVRHLWLLD